MQHAQFHGGRDNEPLDMRSLMHTLPRSSQYPSEQSFNGPTTSSEGAYSTPFYLVNTIGGDHFSHSADPSFPQPQYGHHQWNTHASPMHMHHDFNIRQGWHGKQSHFHSNMGIDGFARPSLPLKQPEYHNRQATEATHAALPAMGPPRKPKQSGFALWVGNLPADVSLTELKDYFARGFTQEIESVFLIAKSNCAFVNYRTETACSAALVRFHRSLFRGRALVCRVRNAPSSPAAPRPDAFENNTTNGHVTKYPNDVADATEAREPLIVGGDSPTTATTPETDSAEPLKTGERFFVLKSLTLGDLEASLRDGTWSTQPHNEQQLSEAYEQCANVYLIFSANKSGEYFGYARMASPITTKVNALKNAVGPPSSTPSPATASAPRGCIVDDPSRGTLFWEAVPSDEGDPSPNDETNDSDSRHEGSRSFAIQWLSTKRVPFHYTRGLRNPYNSNREIKIARDGTEVQPGVAKRVLRLFEEGPLPGSFAAASPMS